jgi:hypothetical protein
MLFAGFGKLLAGACTDVAQWICVLRTALKKLSCERRDSRTIARYRDRLCDYVDVALRKSSRY